jgi:glutamate-1-semialdehyde 2,1-aminomutase
LDETGEMLASELAAIDRESGMQNQVNQIGSMFTYFFTHSAVRNFDEAKTSDTEAFGRYFRAMLAEGVYLAPSQFESLFFSLPFCTEGVDHFLTAHRNSLKRQG